MTYVAHEMPAPQRPAILIGVDILSRFEKVTLDFAHNEVNFRLPDTSNVRQVHA